jgi:hypothetical protein
MYSAEYSISTSNALTISPDSLPGDRYVSGISADDHADLTSSWENAWIDIGGEG